MRLLYKQNDKDPKREKKLYKQFPDFSISQKLRVAKIVSETIGDEMHNVSLCIWVYERRHLEVELGVRPEEVLVFSTNKSREEHSNTDLISSPQASSQQVQYCSYLGVPARLPSNKVDCGSRLDLQARNEEADLPLLMWQPGNADLHQDAGVVTAQPAQSCVGTTGSICKLLRGEKSTNEGQRRRTPRRQSTGSPTKIVTKPVPESNTCTALKPLVV